jgi:hypothetical protein
MERKGNKAKETGSRYQWEMGVWWIKMEHHVERNGSVKEMGMEVMMGPTGMMYEIGTINWLEGEPHGKDGQINSTW